MTNGELRKILERFPPEGPIKVRRAGTQIVVEEVDRAEMQIDATPLRLAPGNVAWTDLIKERMGVVLVFGEPKVAEDQLAAPAGNKP